MRTATLIVDEMDTRLLARALALLADDVRRDPTTLYFVDGDREAAVHELWGRIKEAEGRLER